MKGIFLSMMLFASGILQLVKVYGQKIDDRCYVFQEWMPRTELKDVIGSNRYMYSCELQIGLPPVNLGKRIKWVNVVKGAVMAYNWHRTPSVYSGLGDDFTDLQYGMILSCRLDNPKWSLFFAPKISVRSATDIIQLAHSTFASGIVLVNYNPDGRKKLVVSFGCAYANDFSRNVIIPIAGLTYNDNKLCIEIVYPRVHFLYKPQPKVEWGITASVNGAIYNTPDMKLPDDKVASYTRIISAQAGHTFNYILTRRTVLHSCIGYSFVRNYDLMNDQYQPIETASLDFRQSVFVRTGVSLRF